MEPLGEKTTKGIPQAGHESPSLVVLLWVDSSVLAQAVPLDDTLATGAEGAEGAGKGFLS